MLEAERLNLEQQLAAVTKERDDLKERLLSEQALLERYEYKVIPSLRAQVNDLTRRLAESEKAQLPSFEMLCKIWERVFKEVVDLQSHLAAVTKELAEARNPNCDGSLAFHLAEANVRENDLRAHVRNRD